MREPEDPGIRQRHGSLYVVADGMGGHRAGEIASRLAVEATLDAYYRMPPSGDGALPRAIGVANRHILESASTREEWAGMGCTIVACLVREGGATIAHLGDSRAYLIRDGHVRLLTRDHLYLTEVLGLEEAAARRSRQRHVLSRALGVGEALEVDVDAVALVAGDRIVLCTDGVTNVVDGDELPAIVDGVSPCAAVRRLLALARDRRTADDASALVIELMAGGGTPRGE
jgi:protein phosphatase